MAVHRRLLQCASNAVAFLSSERLGFDFTALLAGGVPDDAYWFHGHQCPTGNHVIKDRQQSIHVRLVFNDLYEHGQIRGELTRLVVGITLLAPNPATP